MGEEAPPADPAPAEPPKEGETPENADGEPVEEVEEELNPIVDLSSYFIKPDQFDGIHVLDEALEKVDGAPNFRNIPGDEFEKNLTSSQKVHQINSKMSTQQHRIIFEYFWAFCLGKG